MEENKITESVETTHQTENHTFATATETAGVKTETKKTWVSKNKAILIAVAAVVVATIVTLVICLNAFTYHGTKPELDLRDAKRNLEDNDYHVTVEDDKNDLDPGIEEEYYAISDDYDDKITFIVCEDAAYAKKLYEAIEFAYKTQIKSAELQIDIIEYQLEHYDNDLSSYEIDDLEDSLKELKNELEEYKEEYVYGRSGNIVWYGTERAAEDTKR